MEEITRESYFKKKYDSQTNTYYLELKKEIKSYLDLSNDKLKNEIKELLTNDNKGAFVTGLRICFKYKNELYFIIHEHQTNEFIYKLVEILKYNNATDIFIKYGEID